MPKENTPLTFWGKNIPPHRIAPVDTVRSQTASSPLPELLCWPLRSC